LVAIAQKTSSLLELQPTRFVIVKSPFVKEKIMRASWTRPAVGSAPIFIAFAGDRNVSIPADETLKESYEFLFSHKPLGFGWLCKALLVPFLRLFSPTPELPAVHKRAWLYKELSLSAMHFMIAAETAGLSYSVIHLFDENRVKRALNLPRSYVVPFILALGYSKESASERDILPLSDVIIRL
jgi:nitroreductase